MAAAVARTFQKEIVTPRWWSGRWVIEPSRFIINGGGKLSSDDCHENSWLGQEIQEKYKDVGVIHIQNTGLTDMKDQRALARIVMGEEIEYEGGANPRGRDEGLGNVYDIGAPLQANLHYHHEMT